MEVEIQNKKYQVSEMKYIDAVGMNPNDKKEMIRTMFKSCLGMTDEEVNSLSISDGQKAEEAIANINGITTDFQEPIEKKE